jgi:hypothetical protein
MGATAGTAGEGVPAEATGGSTGASEAGATAGAAGAGLVSPICGRAGAGWGDGEGDGGAAGGLAPPVTSALGPSWVWLISDSDMRESPPCVVHEARPAACTTTGSVPSPLTESGSNRAPSRSIH